MDQDVKRDVPSNLISAEELGIKDSHPGYTLDLTKLWNTKRDGTGTMYAD